MAHVLPSCIHQLHPLPLLERWLHKCLSARSLIILVPIIDSFMSLELIDFLAEFQILTLSFYIPKTVGCSFDLPGVALSVVRLPDAMPSFPQH